MNGLPFPGICAGTSVHQTIWSIFIETARLIKEYGKAGLPEENTCKKLMAVLARAKKSRQLVRINPSQEDILQKPELIPRPEVRTGPKHHHGLSTRNAQDRAIYIRRLYSKTGIA
jgi:hypothetical protein